MIFRLSRPSSPFRDATYAGIAILMCFIASAYYIYDRASAKNSTQNRERVEAVGWRTASSLDVAGHATLAATEIGQLDSKEYTRLQTPLRNSKVSEEIVSRIYTVAFDNAVSRMILDSDGFPARSWERLPTVPGKSGDFSKETIHYCTLAVYTSGKAWVGEINYPGSVEPLVMAIVPILGGNQKPKGVVVVESTSDRLQPTLASLQSAAWSSVLMGSLISLLVAIAIYSFRKKNISDTANLAKVERVERALVDAIGEAIYRFDPREGSILWQGNLSSLGWDAVEKIPTTRSQWLEHIHEQDVEKCRAAWSGPIGSKWHVEYRLAGQDGRIHWVLDRGQKLEFSKNEPLAVGSILNVTPVREVEQRLNDIVDAAGEYIWEVDAAGHYTYLSARVFDVLGYSPEMLLGRSPLSLVPADHIEAVSSRSAALTDSQSAFRDFEHPMVRADGVTIWLSVNGVPVINTQGRLVGFRGAGLDITARIHGQADLIREKEAAQAADHAKSEFLAVMSHEIRTPLNSVLGFADLLIESGLSPAQYDQMQMIRRSGDALLVLLNDILDFSRIESGKMLIQLSTVSVRDCLLDVVDLYRASAAVKNIALSVSVHEEVPEFLCTDPGRLRQILLNLIGNAVKFTPSGSITISAYRAQVDHEDGRFPLLIEIADTGIGVPPDRLARLFKPFSQADSSTTRRFGGTGLGLVICQRLAELLGGHVRIVRSSPAGTVFALTLPLVALPPAQEPTEQIGSNDFRDVPFRNTGRRVLIVEDNAANRVLAQRMLLALGVESDVAEHGQQAVEAHLAEAYDVIFMDLQMPVMDGFKAVAAIREMEAHALGSPHAYIVAFTADALESDRQRCLHAGMDDYLSKPIRRAELAGALSRAAATSAAV